MELERRWVYSSFRCEDYDRGVKQIDYELIWLREHFTRRFCKSANLGYSFVYDSEFFYVIITDQPFESFDDFSSFATKNIVRGELKPARLFWAEPCEKQPRTYQMKLFPEL